MNNKQRYIPEHAKRKMEEIAIERRKRQLQNNMPLYIIFGAVVLLIIFAVVTLVLVTNFNKNDPLKKLSNSSYTYKIGTTKYEVAYKDANKNGVLYINMNEIAKVCNLTITGDSINDFKVTSPNKQYIRFVNGSTIVSINKYDVFMSSPAIVENNVCHIPLSFLEYVTEGIEIEVNNVKNIVKIVRVETDNSTKAKPEYTDLVFLAKTISPIAPPINFISNLDEYEVYMNPDSFREFLLLVNKTNPLGESYVPNNRIFVDDHYCISNKEIELVNHAAKALEAMMIEMHAAGYKNIFVTSGYRSYTYQKDTFERNVVEEKANPQNASLSDEQIRALVNKYSAIAGQSEHQSGLCADLIDNEHLKLDESFANYPVYKWLSQNAWKFGFIERYPSDKVDITGYDYEPWHYRYVGRQAAYEIHSKGICFEEYLTLKGQ